MYFTFIYHKFELFGTILLAFVAVIGDCLVRYFNLQIYKALFDNSTHAIIGGLTWFLVIIKSINKPARILSGEIFLCAFIASVIDVDHFIAANSLKLKNATNLQGRPFLHCSTIPIIITIVLLILAKLFVSETFYRLAWILFAAFSSHHIRDSTRRGLWFYHFGSTPPLPYFLYISITMAIPHVISMVNEDSFNSLKIQFYAVSGVLAFFIIVLIAVVIDLSIKLRKFKKGKVEEDEDEPRDEHFEESRQRPPPPPVNSAFSFPKPGISKNWHERDSDAEIRRANDQREFSIPKPALSKSWQAYSGERDRNQPKRNQGNDFRRGHDDNASNYSYEGAKSPTFKNSGSAFRNPLSGESDHKYDHDRSDRSERQSRQPSFKLPAKTGSDNFGFKRDFQRNTSNNYY